MIRPKLIVTDLDGTALRSDHTISPHTIEAFARCHAAHIPIAIATARSFREIPAYLPQLHADYQILFDGTMIYSTVKDTQLLYSDTMSLATTHALLKQFFQYHYLTHISIPTIHGIFRYPTASSPKFLQTPIPTVPKQPDSSTNYLLDSKNPFPYPANKMIVSIPSEAEAARIARECDCDYFGYRGEDRYTFYAKGAGKAKAISQLACLLQIPLESVLAFGDDRNDIPMLQRCGCGVAMGNALDEVKKAANIVTDTNENDGIAAILNTISFS